MCTEEHFDPFANFLAGLFHLFQINEKSKKNKQTTTTKQQKQQQQQKTNQKNFTSKKFHEANKSRSQQVTVPTSYDPN